MPSGFSCLTRHDLRRLQALKKRGMPVVRTGSGTYLGPLSENSIHVPFQGRFETNSGPISLYGEALMEQNALIGKWDNSKR